MNGSANTNEYLTVNQVAELLQLHWQTILNYIKSGKLPAIKLGKGYRVSRIELDIFIELNKTNITYAKKR